MGDLGCASSLETRRARHRWNNIGPWRYCRQRPTLPRSFPRSTIGGIRLNFRVRNGNGCDPDPMTTGIHVPGRPSRELCCLGCRLRLRGKRRRIVPDNLVRNPSGVPVLKEQPSPIAKSDGRPAVSPVATAVSEYSANGSLTVRLPRVCAWSDPPSPKGLGRPLDTQWFLRARHLIDPGFEPRI